MLFPKRYGAKAGDDTSPRLVEYWTPQTGRGVTGMSRSGGVLIQVPLGSRMTGPMGGNDDGHVVSVRRWPIVGDRPTGSDGETS